MRAAPLTTIKGGINRLRIKGGARADNLYDLLNGYVTEADTVHVRPGTERIAKLLPQTVGITSFQGSLHTFSHAPGFVPDGFILHVLVNPNSTVDTTFTLTQIHFAEPFMGALYVVAEFDDGNIYHYWLQEGEQWEANHHYAAGALVFPEDPSGLVYQATRLGDPYPAWAPNVPRFDGDGYEDASIIEPTVYNDFYYVCVEAVGTSPRSGATEPTWPTEDGAQVSEFADGGTVSTGTPTTTTPPSTSTPTGTLTDRYGSYRDGRVSIP